MEPKTGGASNEPKRVRIDAPGVVGLMHIDVSDLEELPNALIAVFDILGIRELMRHAASDLHLAAHMKTVLDAATITGEEQSIFEVDGKRSSASPFILHVSDTVLLISSGSQPEDVLQFLWNAHQVMFVAMHSGLPLRGAVTIGDIVVSRERRLFVGSGLVDALELERAQEWSGACLSTALMEHIASIGLAERVFPLVLPYEVPWKSAQPVTGANYAVNWVADWMSFIAPNFLPTKFPKIGSEEQRATVERKISNTQSFLTYALEVHAEKGPFGWPDNRHFELGPHDPQLGGRVVRVVTDPPGQN